MRRHLWLKVIARDNLRGAHMIPIGLTKCERTCLEAARTILAAQTMDDISLTTTIIIATLAVAER